MLSSAQRNMSPGTLEHPAHFGLVVPLAWGCSCAGAWAYGQGFQEMHVLRYPFGCSEQECAERECALRGACRAGSAKGARKSRCARQQQAAHPAAAAGGLIRPFLRSWWHVRECLCSHCSLISQHRPRRVKTARHLRFAGKVAPPRPKTAPEAIIRRISPLSSSEHGT